MKKKMLVVIGILGILGVGFSSSNYIKELEKINAETSRNRIVLDSDSVFNYELPSPSTELFEPALINNPDFSGFVQNNEIKTVIDLANESEESNTYITGNSFFDVTGASILEGENPGFLISENSNGISGPNGERATTDVNMIFPSSDGSFDKIYSLMTAEVFNEDNFQSLKKPEISAFAPTVLPLGNNENAVLVSAGEKQYIKRINTETYANDENSRMAAQEINFGNLDGNIFSRSIFNRSRDYNTGEVYMFGRGMYNDPSMKKASVFNVDIDSGNVTGARNFQIPKMTAIENYYNSRSVSLDDLFYELSSLTTLNDGTLFGTFNVGNLSLHSEIGMGWESYSYMAHWDEFGNLLNGDESIVNVNVLGSSGYSVIEFIPSSNSVLLSRTEGLNQQILSVVDGKFSKSNILLTEWSKENTLNLSVSNLNERVRYSFVGQINSTETGMFMGYSPGFSIGFLDKDFNVVSASSTPSDLPGINGQIYFSDKTNEVFVAGGYSYTGAEGERAFLTIPPAGGFSGVTNRSTIGYFGKLGLYNDYAPAIKTGKYSVVSQKELTEATTPEQLNELLLYGGGNKYPIEVYHTIDGNTPEKLEDLRRRINLNPRNLNLPIDWQNLGVNTSEIGPNNGTFFVSDSQLLTTVANRTVNIIDNKTEYDEGKVMAAIHAENFVIDLADVGDLTKDRLTQLMTTDTYGHVLAWDLESGTNLNDSVVVDDDDFKALKAATEFGRFPLRYSITRNGETVTNETMVFVKGETEAISEDEKYLISAQDFSVATKDYPITDDAVTTMIHNKAKAKLFNVTTNTDMDLSNLVITKGQLPGANTDGSYVPDGKYKVLLSYGTKGTKSYVEKEITVTVTQSTFEMTLNQVYADKTSQTIYSNLETKATVDNSPTYTQDYGKPIQSIVDKLFTDEIRTLNYQGYETLVSSAYTVSVGGVKVTPTPKYVPAEDFTVEFQYTGQLKFKDTAAQLEFGSIPITNSLTTTALTSDSDDTVSIINTDLTQKWRLKTSVPDGINRLDNPHPFVGDLYYQDGKGEGVPIGEEAVLIEAQQETDTTLLSQVNLRVNQTTGLFLRQGVGNLKGTYEGKLVWTLEDGPDPAE